MATSPELTLDPVAIRSDFPILRPDEQGNRVFYLDSAASSQKPEAVINAIDHYYRNDNANVHRGVYQLAERATEAYEQARAKVARYFSVDDEAQVIFTRNTTEAINLVASSWGRVNLGPGDRILFSVMEHHSNIVPWQLIAQQTGAELGFIEMDERGRLSLDNLDEQLSRGDVKIVAVAHVSNMLGTVNPVEEIIARAHRAGAVVLLDGAQAAPHRPVDVTKLDVDFYACSAHKMCGPMGIGMLYGKRELLDAMPPYMGGGEMIRVVELERSTYADIPAKFEAGTPSVADAVGFGAACDYLAGVGPDAILAHERHLTKLAFDQLSELPGLTIYGPDLDERAGVISFNVGQVHPHDIASVFDSSGVAVRAGHHCTQPLHNRLGINASVRASFYLYNTEEDVERLMEALGEVYRIFDQEAAPS